MSFAQFGDNVFDQSRPSDEITNAKVEPKTTDQDNLSRSSSMGVPSAGNHQGRVGNPRRA